jgi:hypothetical protein
VQAGTDMEPTVPNALNILLTALLSMPFTSPCLFGILNILSLLYSRIAGI